MHLTFVLVIMYPTQWYEESLFLLFSLYVYVLIKGPEPSS